MKRLFLLFCFCVLCFTNAYSQVSNLKNESQWIVISDDDIVTIAYNKNITDDQKGYHYVWVKATYYGAEWEDYFYEMIGGNTPVSFTMTKAHYTEDYNFVMVRQVLLYSKTGKLLFDTGDDRSAGWYPVNASDPVGIVGEKLGDLLRK